MESLRFFNVVLVILAWITFFGKNASTQTNFGGPGQSSTTTASTNTAGVLAKAPEILAALNNPEVQTINEVLAAYPGATLTRPAPPQEITNVTISLTINSFEGIDDLQEIMSFSGLIIVSWHDNYLRWSKFAEQVSYIRLRFKDVWLPLFIQSSSPGTAEPILQADNNSNSDVLRVSSNGTVTAVAAGTFQTQCNLDFTDFPFDSQSCSYSFQGWGYTYDLMSLEVGEKAYMTETSDSVFSPQWVITDISVESGETYFLGDPYSALTYTITAARRPMYYLMNVLLPCALMSVLALGTFLFPIDNTRASYAVTVVLGFAIYQTVVVQSLPQTATRISLMLYIITEMLLSAFIALHSAISDWLVCRYSRSGNPLPSLFAYLSRRKTNRYKRQKIPKETLSSSIPPIQASLRIVETLRSEKIERRYEEDWVYFFNFVDTIVMLFCITVSVVIPVLIFCTSVFHSGSSVESSVETNYVENFYERTTSAPPNISRLQEYLVNQTQRLGQLKEQLQPPARILQGPH